MSELRHDPLSGHDVIVAAGRAARPVTFARNREAGPRGTRACPFCPGAEAETPPEVARTGPGAPGTPGWRVRVFPNLYPIVDTHEVIALSPAHDRSLAQLGDDEVVEVFSVMRDRIRVHLAAGHAYAVAILNHLRPAGASIEHPHAQVFALDVVPAAVGAALSRFDDAGHDLVLDDAAGEDHVVGREPSLVWCPRASTSPYLVRLAHEHAGRAFDTADDSTIASIAIAVRDTLARLDAALGDPPYNLGVHTAPPADVWRAVERIENHTEWMLDAETITFRTEQHSGVGAEFDCLTRVGPLHTTDHFAVTKWEPGSVMGIEHRGAVKGTGEFRLRPTAAGDATDFCWEEALTFPWWLGGLAGQRVGRPVLKRIWEGNLARLKARIEGAR